MKVKREIAANGENLPIVKSTRYAFSNKLEAMFALGITGAFLDRVFTDDQEIYESTSYPYVSINHTKATVLDFQVQMRESGFSVPSAMDGVEEFLTDGLSTHLWSAIDWATLHRGPDDKFDTGNGFPSVVAGGLILRSAINEIENSAFQAGRQLLSQGATRSGRVARGLGRTPQLPNVVVNYELSSPTQPDAVTVVTANATQLV